MKLKKIIASIGFLLIYVPLNVIAQNYPPNSKFMYSSSGAGMNNFIERVSPCVDQIYDSHHYKYFDEGYFGFREYRDEKRDCHKACATVTYKNSSDFTFYDDDGNPLFGTETHRIKREAMQICGTESCNGDDVMTSCEAKVKPYLEICLANGYCKSIDRKLTNSHQNNNKNPYYLNTNPKDIE